jgi:hypothetical protein
MSHLQHARFFIITYFVYPTDPIVHTIVKELPEEYRSTNNIRKNNKKLNIKLSIDTALFTIQLYIYTIPTEQLTSPTFCVIPLTLTLLIV